MVEVLVVEQLPSAAQYNRLRAAVGWGVYAEDVIERALPNTLYCVCAYVDGDLVGMARIIGDGAMVYYIQDVIVLPAYQRQGIGARMMGLVMDYIRTHASHNTIVGLMAACGKEPFYEKYGFTRRPTERLGAGMTMFWD
ncbi:MAG: GNAT family N-acetyltransferase [Anaerolineae bacterium]